ncbi:MAG: hypothetical protein NTU79_22435 [Planctomycetota bacterium]|nr:hypothetical protein [Planctomycetota bacterium]
MSKPNEGMRYQENMMVRAILAMQAITAGAKSLNRSNLSRIASYFQIVTVGRVTITRTVLRDCFILNLLRADPHRSAAANQLQSNKRHK